jgi:hypothetical protein
LRSASLLPAIIGRHDRPYLAWLTDAESVDLVTMLGNVDEVIEPSAIGLARVATGGLDFVYSLSNDLPSASLATTARVKKATVDGLVAKVWTDRLDCLVCYGDCSKDGNCMSLLDPRPWLN